MTEARVHVHETRLASHPFVNHNTPNSLEFRQYSVQGQTIVELSGQVYCHQNVIVEVTKYFETRLVQGRLQVRGRSYRYNASIRGRYNILRCDNGHDENPDEFHRHLYSLNDGSEIEKRTITRYELPVFVADILTELQKLLEG